MSMRILSSWKVLKLYKECKPDEKRGLQSPQEKWKFMLDPYIRDIRLRNEYVKWYYCGRLYLFHVYLSAKGY